MLFLRVYGIGQLDVHDQIIHMQAVFGSSMAKSNTPGYLLFVEI
jgi:hypothetical protein